MRRAVPCALERGKPGFAFNVIGQPGKMRARYGGTAKPEASSISNAALTCSPSMYHTQKVEGAAQSSRKIIPGIVSKIEEPIKPSGGSTAPLHHSYVPLDSGECATVHVHVCVHVANVLQYLFRNSITPTGHKLASLLSEAVQQTRKGNRGSPGGRPTFCCPQASCHPPPTPLATWKHAPGPFQCRRCLLASVPRPLQPARGEATQRKHKLWRGWGGRPLPPR